jgi:hypothetical protein
MVLSTPSLQNLGLQKCLIAIPSGCWDIGRLSEWGWLITLRPASGSGDQVHIRAVKWSVASRTAFARFDAIGSEFVLDKVLSQYVSVR